MLLPSPNSCRSLVQLLLCMVVSDREPALCRASLSFRQQLCGVHTQPFCGSWRAKSLHPDRAPPKERHERRSQTTVACTAHKRTKSCTAVVMICLLLWWRTAELGCPKPVPPLSVNYTATHCGALLRPHNILCE